MSLSRKIARANAKATLKKAQAALKNIPPPGKDAEGNCLCGCIHRPDKGACPKFVPCLQPREKVNFKDLDLAARMARWELNGRQPGGDRCAECDHSLACHNHKARPTAWNVAVELLKVGK